MQDLRTLATARPWLVLPIESNVRELHARTLLAAVAAERGFGVLVCRVAELARVLPAVPRAVLLYMSAITPSVFDMARKHQHIPTALDEEGLVQRSREDYLERRMPRASLERCERFFAWGEEQRTTILSRHGDFEDRVIAVGNPRIDVLRPGLREIYRPQASALNDGYGRFILLSSNFGTFNHQLGVNTRIQEWRAKGWADSGETEKRLLRTINFQRRMFEEFVDLAEALDRVLPPDVRIVVRPHPAERQETWRDRLQHLSRTDVVHQGSVLPWLLSASALVHNSCTTGIEATLLGRPSLAYMPFRDAESESPLPNETSIRVTERDSLVGALSGALREGPAHVEGTPLTTLEKHITNISGRLASEAIVDELEKIAPPPSGFRKVSSVPARIRWGRAQLRLRSFASGVRHRDLRRKKQISAYIRRSSPGIDTPEVTAILAGISRASARFDDVACVEVAPDLVLIGRPS